MENRVMNLLMKKNKGFTLIEMMIVVAIIGILSALAIPSYNKFIAHQNLNAAARDLFSDMRSARVSAISQGVQYGIYFPSTTEFEVIKVINAPTYTSFVQAQAAASSAGLTQLYSEVTDYKFSTLSYYGITMSVPVNTPVFQKSGAVSSAIGISGINGSFSSVVPDVIIMTNSYGEQKKVIVNTAGFVSIQ
jgi:prepilin-type N-terminal cleavage/methylation domain-containing protein